MSDAGIFVGGCNTIWWWQTEMKGWGGNKLCKVSRHPYPQLGRGQGGLETATVGIVTIMGGQGWLGRKQGLVFHNGSLSIVSVTVSPFASITRVTCVTCDGGQARDGAGDD